jgi:hypothetical protein
MVFFFLTIPKPILILVYFKTFYHLAYLGIVTSGSQGE